MKLSLTLTLRDCKYWVSPSHWELSLTLKLRLSVINDTVSHLGLINDWKKCRITSWQRRCINCAKQIQLTNMQASEAPSRTISGDIKRYRAISSNIREISSSVKSIMCWVRSIASCTGSVNYRPNMVRPCRICTVTISLQITDIGGYRCITIYTSHSSGVDPISNLFSCSF